MTKDEIAYLLLRVTLGANLFLHGFSRLIGNHVAFATHVENEMQNTPLPGFLVHSVAVVLPWCEGTVGLLMILGLWTSLALMAGSLLMLTLQHSHTTVRLPHPYEALLLSPIQKPFPDW